MSRRLLALPLVAVAFGFAACGWESPAEKAESKACPNSYVQELKPDNHTLGHKKVNYWVTCQDGSIGYVKQ